MVSKTYCPLPFIALTTDTMGHTRACCASTSNLLTSMGGPVDLSKLSMGEAFNSKGQANVRKAMLQGEIPDECAPCFELEKYTKSSRQHALDTWKDLRADLVAKRVTEAREKNGRVEAKPLFLDLRFGNKCNLECLSCNVTSSSRLHERLSQISPQDVLLSELAISPQDRTLRYDWYSKTSFESDLREMIHPDLLMINFAGGEPLILREYERVLEYCLEQGLGDQLEVRIVTNGTSTNPRMFELLKKFKRVLLTVSVDAYKEGNDYLRPPSKWSQFQRNWKQFLELPDSFHLFVNCVVQPFNVLELASLLTMLVQGDDRKRFNFNPLYSTNEPWLDARILPAHIRKIAIGELHTFFQQNGAISEHTCNAVKEVISFLEETPLTSSEEKSRCAQFLERAYKNDKLYRSNWKAIFPRLHYLLSCEH